ncbi:MAG: HypC/HybG/HupF family hydrogenase formation chaperone [Candidatus Nealsonbacteria bacterium CG_4_8_14_3_um_filter_39_7]|uniref:HypC/HybG/HupF family hydrogenase formation chaperone n=1 Tax=Candidatus Nealsonbacteria bacterium CG23_combo_of_CG06-09_8_20_14_all_39_17 TaxID=1974722 RepID=A0A2G9YUZ5_9BACT|nr:MAG: HypC/HybG/HupF family hydrogenase formation chaperone [Candidatus Nealsonbacteria bacterium CG23_combo_of_CG06-09_8_20_14_all_39_17]PIU43689.1 MAG: HypC/HybG/HupF family hydrogenase formation chaperone [Candidatus Nealsonbacteria bacterium CG07_land_8_20_14_0_80_39_13]PIW91732.1 MAG: HypC/HybG/HupF family hydrogenase formation chaperone [Candidatus Nealsonbacteria bacterium CG_4_8_14_3_um_filter_39_7]
MCIGVPGKVILIKGDTAKIEQNGHSHWVNVSSLTEKVKKGDYLLTYQDVAINKVSAKQAKEVLKLHNK